MARSAVLEIDGIVAASRSVRIGRPRGGDSPMPPDHGVVKSTSALANAVAPSVLATRGDGGFRGEGRPGGRGLTGGARWLLAGGCSRRCISCWAT